MKTQGKVICQPQGTSPADTLVLDFSFQNGEEIHACWLSLWNFVTAVLLDSYMFLSGGTGQDHPMGPAAP